MTSGAAQAAAAVVAVAQGVQDSLAFRPDPVECPKCPTDGCDLTCVWEPEPLRWEGDDS